MSNINKILFYLVVLLVLSITLVVLIVPMMSRKKDVIVPDVEGFVKYETIKTLENSNLEIEIVYVEDDYYERDIVIRTIPPVGTTVKEESTVKVEVALGNDYIVLPDLSNLYYEEENDVIKKLVDKNIKIVIKEVYNDIKQIGTVVSFFPEEESLLKSGDVLYLEVSKGSDYYVLPNFQGYYLEDALDILNNHNIKYEIEYKDSSIYKENFVLEQNIKPTSKMYNNEDNTITLTLSTGEKEFIMPDFFGMNVYDAIIVADILEIDYKIVSSESSSYPVNTVIEQSIEVFSNFDRLDEQITFTISIGWFNGRFNT